MHTELEVLKLVSERLEAARVPCMLTGVLLEESVDRKYLGQWDARLGVAEILAGLSP